MVRDGTAEFWSWRPYMSATMKVTRWSAAVAALVFVLPSLAGAQAKSDDPCSQRHSDRPSHCEVRDTTLAAQGGSLAVSAAPNGGIKVRGWNRPDVQVRAVVVTQADTVEEAAALARQIQVLTDGGRVRSEGPRQEDGHGWSVSFDVMVPSQLNLDLSSTNGGISLSDVVGRAELRTTNGGLQIARVGGHVTGNTTNGGVTVELEGATWNGEGLDVTTHNGGVDVRLPDNYSAHLEAGTTNGGVRVDFPVTVNDSTSRKISTDIGSGGPTIRVMTVNGGVKIGRR
jgi:hypothetical protein